MRLVSTAESATSGEASVLAIVETILAISLVFYLSAHLNTVRWLAIAMLVSPLLLLRTQESTSLGIKWFDAMIERVPAPESEFITAIEFLFIGTAIAFTARVAATVVATVKAPTHALQAIAQNWWRLTFATDSFLEPELVPGHKEVLLTSLLATVRPGTRARLLAVPAFLPALFYRWSLKATSIIYAPLVFVTFRTFKEGTDLRTKLNLIRRSDLSRIRVGYGVLAVVAFMVKLILMNKWIGFVDWWKGHPVSEFLALYVTPAEVPKWQIAEVANSVLAIGVMLFVRYALLRYELRHPLPEAPVKRLLGFVGALRWLLALYTILCTGYLTIREAQKWHWPALGEKWVPWQ
jgi:hypothetical protein